MRSSRSSGTRREGIGHRLVLQLLWYRYLRCCKPGVLPASIDSLSRLCTWLAYGQDQTSFNVRFVHLNVGCKNIPNHIPQIPLLLERHSQGVHHSLLWLPFRALPESILPLSPKSNGRAFRGLTTNTRGLVLLTTQHHNYFRSIWVVA